jgi:hypothetical protein
MKKTNYCQIGRRLARFEIQVHVILLKIFCDVCNFPTLIFFLAIMKYNMTRRRRFHIVWIIFEFIMPVSNYIQNGRHEDHLPGAEAR